MIDQDAERYAEKLIVLIDAENDQDRMNRLIKLLDELQVCRGVIKSSPPALRHKEILLPAVIRKIQAELGETE